MINHTLQRKLSELSTEQLSAVYQQVFNNDAGMLVLEDLRNRSFCFVPTFSQPERQRENEGMRSIVLHIETMINPQPKPAAEKEPDNV